MKGQGGERDYEFFCWRASGNQNELCLECENANYCTSCFVRAFEINKVSKDFCKWYSHIPAIIKEKIFI